jgi:hypothetical protein
LALFSGEQRAHPLPPKRRREANSLYFDEDFKRLRKDRMESQLRRDDKEANLRIRIMTAQAEELEERVLLQRQMRRYLEKAEANLDSGQNTVVLPFFPPFNGDPSSNNPGLP